MKHQVKKRLVRSLVFGLIAIVLGVCVAWIQIQTQNARITKKGGQKSETAIPMAGLNIGGPFNLTDHNGNQVTEKTYAGDYKLMYFGFTYCPAICPTELQKMSRVMNALEKNVPELASIVQPLFVTVDPERDEVSVMKQYVSLFHKKLIGLTGTQPQIDFVKQRYRIFATKVEDETNQDYTVDHSSFIYLMSPENDLISMYRTSDTADYMYEDILERIKLSGS